MRGALGLLQRIDLARLEALEQFLRRDVDHDDFVCVVENLVGHGFMHLDAHDATHHIVEAFQVLHVERGPDIDAGSQQFLRILATLGMARTRHIAVRQLVQQQYLGMALQRGIEIELGQLPPLVGQMLARQLFQAMQLLLGLGPAMRFHQPHQHFMPCLAFALRSRQHGVGLAHAGVGAEVNAQLAARGKMLLGLQLGDQRVGIGARGKGWGMAYGHRVISVSLACRETRRMHGSEARAQAQHQAAAPQAAQAPLAVGCAVIAGIGRCPRPGCRRRPRPQVLARDTRQSA